MSSPTITGLVLTRTADRGLPRLLGELTSAVDEVLVGVDSTATEETVEIARAHAHAVFRFEHVGPPALLRLPTFARASGDWVLILDEDEGLDQALADLLPELVASRRFNHYWFQRKWIVGTDPLEYLHGPPWFPDWQLRLFENDLQRVWHPSVMHGGFRAVGAGSREERGAILHYEPLVVEADERARKIELYREHGSGGGFEDYYRAFTGERRPLGSPPARTASFKGPCRELSHVHPLARAPAFPPWSAELRVRMPERAVAGSAVAFEVLARNTGGLSWSPPSNEWPRLGLSFHLHGGSSLQAWDGPRFPVPRDVEVGESVTFLGELIAPAVPGRYRLEWDLVSEGEHWFADCGGATATVPLIVDAL